MRVLFCGDRDWNDIVPIVKELSALPDGSVIIEGEARGADRMAAHAAKVLLAHKNFEVQRYPANWDKFGRAAGPIRNQQMLDEGKPELVIAFHHDIENSKGTKHMVGIAIKAGIKVKLVRE
jgi:hypothetical protein